MSDVDDEALTEQIHVLAAANEGLRARLADLESYLEGRKKHWDEMQVKMTEYRNSLAGMDAVIREHESEKARLSTHIIELERRCAQTEGRLTEKAAAYADLQQELRSEVEAHEKLRHASVRLDSETGTARAEAERNAALNDELRLDIESRDDRIMQLEADLEREREGSAATASSHDKLSERIAHLEESLEERIETIQNLRNELSDAHDELKEARSQQATEWPVIDDSIVVEELSQAESDLDSQQRIAELAGKLEALEAENNQLEAENNANVELIEQLEADLESKRHMLGTMEKSSERLAVISEQLRPIDQTPESIDIGEPVLQSQMIDPDLLFGDEEPVSKPRRRMLPVGKPGAIEYELSKQRMTIGRSSTSDIQVDDTSVSRVHARIIESARGSIIEDSGSTNGVLVNNERVQRAVLHNGDFVALGARCVFRYVEDTEVSINDLIDA